MKRRSFLKILGAVVPAAVGVKAFARDYPWKGISNEILPGDILAANPEPMKYDLRTDPFEEVGTVAWKSWHTSRVMNNNWQVRMLG